MNELVIKLYQDRPPRIGILYGSEFRAGKEYETLIDKFRGESLRARIEINKAKISLTLSSNNSNGKQEYKDLTYNIAQFKKFQVFVKQDTEIHFVHVYTKTNKSFMAKPQRNGQMEFATINYFELIIRGEFIE
jgi:hypothetical protein